MPLQEVLQGCFVVTEIYDEKGTRTEWNTEQEILYLMTGL